MSALTPLQAKLGGSARALDQAAILRAAQKSLAEIAPQVEEALRQQREGLRAALSEQPVDLQGVFAVAHQIRGVAGTIGRASLGALSDLVATFITDHADAGVLCAPDVVAVLARTLERAFDFAEGDPLLVEALEMSAVLVRRANEKNLAKERLPQRPT